MSATEAPAPAPTPSATKATGPDLSAYAVLSDRDFALLVKDPDAARGQKLVVYGVISQFDAATGSCAFLASVSNAVRESSFDYPENAWFDSGNGKDKCALIENNVEGDHVQLWVTVTGSLSYDTQIGGSTTVPSFKVDQVELLPALEF